MATTLSIRCSCGQFRATMREVSGDSGNHGLCYCDDCQAFAHFLGRPKDILDAHGGSDIFQMSPAQFELVAGHDRLACMRLSPKGLLRWYASCCKTPIGNTLATPAMPFIGIVHSCIVRPPDDPTLQRSLGPFRAIVHQRFAHGDRAALPKAPTSTLGMILRLVRLLLKWRLRGDHKRSPLFHATGKPIVTPHIINESERKALYEAVIAGF